jgi:hypothetical protein
MTDDVHYRSMIDQVQKKKKKMVDASAYFLSRGWLRIFTKPTPPPAISVSVICDRIALIAHTLREGLI